MRTQTILGHPSLIALKRNNFQRDNIPKVTTYKHRIPNICLPFFKKIYNNN